MQRLVIRNMLPATFWVNIVTHQRWHNLLIHLAHQACRQHELTTIIPSTRCHSTRCVPLPLCAHTLDAHTAAPLSVPVCAACAACTSLDALVPVCGQLINASAHALDAHLLQGSHVLDGKAGRRGGGSWAGM